MKKHLCQTRIIFLLLLFISTFFLLFNPICGPIYAQDAKNLKIKKGHPILFVTPAMVEDIRIKENDLSKFHNYVKSSREKNTNDPKNTSLIRSEVDLLTDKSHVNYYINDCSYYGIDAYINDDPLSKEYARQYIYSLLDRPISGEDMQIRGKLFALGALYDWIYDELSSQERKQIREEILDLIDYVDNSWDYISNADFVGGHSRFGNIAVLVALLPIYHDIETENEDRYFGYLQQVVDNWIDGFNPLQNWVNQGGAHNMGWAYGASYSRLFPYIVWEYATEEKTWLTDWQGDRVYWYLYGLRNDNNLFERAKGGYDNFPFSGDVWSTDYSTSFQGFQILFSAMHYDNDYAKWFYNYMGKGEDNMGYRDMFNNNCWDILYNNFVGDEGTPPHDLPLSQYFPNSAFVVMRDSWDFNRNTLMVFKSTSFYTISHQHADQNAFTIYYKGPLAIDAGAYEATGDWGSKHFYNYYIRSIAHNTMLIYDPSEDFNGYSNDGGQYFFPEEYPVLEEMQEGGTNHLDGIQRYEEGSDYTYTMGDATKAYRSFKLSEYKRSIVYLRNHSYDHPVIVIYDKVVSTDSLFRKTYLLHSIKEPSVENNIVIIQGDDGIKLNNKSALFQETILPPDPQISKIGGRENNQEFYVSDDGNGNPHNYIEGTDYDDDFSEHVRALREGGEWRVEVSPRDSNKKDEFLHVISITDGKESFLGVKTHYVSSDNLDGVIVSDNDGEQSTLVLFYKDTVPLNDHIEVQNNIPFNRILIAGLKEETTYAITHSGTGFSIRATAVGKLLSSDQGTLYLDSSFIRIQDDAK